MKQAFLGLARQFHPDRFAAPALADMAEMVKEFFTAVNEAYETLSDDRKRATPTWPSAASRGRPRRRRPGWTS